MDLPGLVPDIDLQVMLNHLAKLLIAYLLALPVAWDREAEKRGAGLRTFPLVAIASCGYMLIGMDILSNSDAYSRVLYGLITGIGFIGGGAILKSNGNVTGTATAASIWNVGAVGAAVAWGRYEIALALSLVNFMTLRFIRPLKAKIPENEQAHGD